MNLCPHTLSQHVKTKRPDPRLRCFFVVSFLGKHCSHVSFAFTCIKLKIATFPFFCITGHVAWNPIMPCKVISGSYANEWTSNCFGSPCEVVLTCFMRQPTGEVTCYHLASFLSFLSSLLFSTLYFLCFISNTPSPVARR